MTVSKIGKALNVVFCNTKTSPSWNEKGFHSGGWEMTILSRFFLIKVESSFFLGRSTSWIFRANLAFQYSVAGIVFGKVG